MLYFLSNGNSGEEYEIKGNRFFYYGKSSRIMGVLIIEKVSLPTRGLRTKSPYRETRKIEQYALENGEVCEVNTIISVSLRDDIDLSPYKDCETDFSIYKKWGVPIV